MTVVLFFLAMMIPGTAIVLQWREIRRLRRLIAGMADRIARQSDLLTQRAEHAAPHPDGSTPAHGRQEV